MERKGISAKPELIRRINRTLILDLLRREGPLSRSDIAARSGMSLPAVSRAIADLIADSWVSEIGAGTSSGGRRPILMQFNSRAGFVVGVDVTPYRLLGGVADLSGDLVVTRSEVPVTLGQPLLDQLTTLIKWLTEKAGVVGGMLTGIGLSVPGIPDRTGNRVGWAPALEWQDLPVGSILQERFDCPVVVQNDVDAMLLGEQWRGAAAGVRYAVAVNVGSGVGAAVLLDGGLYRGRDGAVGEIGHWLTEPEQPPRRKGFGQLESRTAITFLARKWAAQAGWKLGENGDVMAAMVAKALEGDPGTRKLVLEMAGWIGVVVANLVTLLNPEVVILGGEALRLEQLILPVISQIVDSHSPYPAPVVPAQLGDHSAVIGAVYGVLQGQRSSVSYEQ